MKLDWKFLYSKHEVQLRVAAGLLVFLCLEILIWTYLKGL
jgi:hypothetical protein